MRFYKVSSEMPYDSPWVRVCNLWPDTRSIGTPCDLCGVGRLYPGRYPERSFHAELETGTEFPDVLGCGSGSLFIVSERILDDWEACQVTGYEKYPIYLSNLWEYSTQGRDAPQYYHIKVTGRCQLDTEAMGIRVTYYCPQCGYRTEELVKDLLPEEDGNPFEVHPFIIREETWDGSDLFISELFDHCIFCSQRVFDLAGLHERTNFEFTLPEEHHLYKPGIDYIAASRARFGAKLLKADPHG